MCENCKSENSVECAGLKHELQLNFYEAMGYGYDCSCSCHIHKDEIMDLFKQDDFRTQYELARQIGDKRFGSPCSHKRTTGGYCEKCLRKVIVTTTRTR